MNKSAYILGLGLLLYAGACTPPAAKSVSGGTTYQENLAVHRQQYVEPNYTSSTQQNNETRERPPYVAPTHDITTDLDSVMVSMGETVRDIRYIDGLTIQIYTGNDRDRANRIKRAVPGLREGLVAKLIYDQPNYKVQVGAYYNRLEANKDYALLKKSFRRALLVPTKIPIEFED